MTGKTTRYRLNRLRDFAMRAKVKDKMAQQWSRKKHIPKRSAS